MALADAIEGGDVAEVRRLLAAGANPNAHYVSRDGDTRPLVLAVEMGGPEMVRALLDAGARVDAKLDDGYTALGVAVSSENLDMVKLLVEAGANPEVKMGSKTIVDKARELRAHARGERERKTMDEILEALDWVKRGMMKLRKERQEARFVAHEAVNPGGRRKTRKTRRRGTRRRV